MIETLNPDPHTLQALTTASADTPIQVPLGADDAAHRATGLSVALLTPSMAAPDVAAAVTGGALDGLPWKPSARLPATEHAGLAARLRSTAERYGEALRLAQQLASMETRTAGEPPAPDSRDWRDVQWSAQRAQHAAEWLCEDLLCERQALCLALRAGGQQ